MLCPMTARSARYRVALVVIAFSLLSPVRALQSPADGHGQQQQYAGQIYIIQAGDTLEQVAAQFYGTRSAGPAILLATNAAAGMVASIEFIDNPDQLKAGQKLLIPPADEAMQLTAEYDAYASGILHTAFPHEHDVAKSLVTIPVDTKSVVVVTWARANKFKLDQRTATSDIWVTIAPSIKAFCRTIQDRRNLALRLEQRLGLPPLNGKGEFVEIVVADPDKNLFRPCPDSDIHHNGCTVGFGSKGYPPEVEKLTPRQIWFLSQYYQSYALARPEQYPWTALGYTYDWGSEDHVGESEFVIPRGSGVKVQSIARTEDYCRP